MDTAEVFVTTTGVLLIVLILWFFCGPRVAMKARVSQAGRQEVNIIVKGGYSPDRIEVRQGEPVGLPPQRDQSLYRTGHPRGLWDRPPTAGRSDGRGRVHTG